jgi:hypothetical protein
MNEYAVLMRLLTRTGTPMGAGVEDMLEALGLPEDMGRHMLFQKLAGLYRELMPIGLAIMHNPLNHVFYLDSSVRVDSLIEESPLSDRLAATLLVVVTLAYQEGGWVSFERVKEFRRKSMQSIRDDFRELLKHNYLDVDFNGKRVRPGLRVPFEIDYEAFFRRLAGTGSETE